MNVSGRAMKKLAAVTSSFLLPIACCLLSGVSAVAQPAWPERLVRIIVPASAGGGTDTVARIMADHFSRTIGQQFIVENRGGAGGIVGIDAVAKASPDGYMLLVTGSPITSNHLTTKNVPYDAMRDFAPISLLVTLPNILNVHPSVQAKSLPELIALAKSKPGDLTYASAGIGTNPHFAMELFKHMAGIDLRHVPYRGVAPALNDVVAGSVNATMTNILSGKPHAQAGTLRGMAVSSKKRIADLPDVPTFAEVGFPKFEASQWYGFLAPAGTPAAIVARLHEQAVRTLTLPEVRKRLEAEAAEPVANAPAEFAAFMREEIERWTEVARVAGIKP